MLFFRYQKSLSLVMKLFGPKAHEKFPRKYRSPGSGECASGGFYPTDSAGHYEDQGVDLEMPQGAKVGHSEYFTYSNSNVSWPSG